MNFAERIVVMHWALERASIPHGFGGAIALAYAVDEPRATVDIDLNVGADARAPRPVLDAMPDGVRWGAADVLRIEVDGQVRLWWDDVAVDLFFPQHALHAVVGGRYVNVPFGGTTIPVVSPTDLVVFKALFNRTKDWADIEAVVRAGSADVGEALTWIGRIAGRDSPSYDRLVGVARNVSPDEDRPAG